MTLCIMTPLFGLYFENENAYSDRFIIFKCVIWMWMECVWFMIDVTNSVLIHNLHKNWQNDCRSWEYECMLCVQIVIIATLLVRVFIIKLDL